MEVGEVGGGVYLSEFQVRLKRKEGPILIALGNWFYIAVVSFYHTFCCYVQVLCTSPCKLLPQLSPLIDFFLSLYLWIYVYISLDSLS